MNKIDGSNLTWSFNPDSGTLRFEGMGLLPDYLNLLETSSMSEVGKDERDAMVPWGEHVDKIRHLEAEGLLEVSSFDVRMASGFRGCPVAVSSHYWQRIFL